MRPLLIALASACAATSLAGCASDGYGFGGFGSGYYGGPPMGYDAFYDDAYGPFDNGYWGRGDVFYYRTTPSGRYQRDASHHFRHDGGTGFHDVHGHGEGHQRP